MTERMKAADLIKLRNVGAHPDASEDTIHTHILNYLRMALPGAFIHHSPNQVQRSGKAAKVEVQKKKAMGMVPGYPDLLIYGRKIGELMGVPVSVTGQVEVKRPGEYPKPHQREVLADLKARGHIVHVCKSVDDARQFVLEFKAAEEALRHALIALSKS